MLSSATLERASISYRNGYLTACGYREMPNDRGGSIDNGSVFRPFANYDFDEGFKAGANDWLWIEFHSGNALATDLMTKALFKVPLT